MIGLGVESSCDETSIAVVEDGVRELANVVYSQTKEHAPFRGVVPEIASRAHLEKLNFLFEEAVEKAGTRQFDYVSVTSRPGLMGPLMMGAQFAKMLSLVTRIPVIPVDHLEAHFYASCLEGRRHEYPFLGLLLSGGNSALYQVDGPGKMTVLVETMDDACGEAFDKTATVLGLGYPGGPAIEKAATSYAGSEAPLFRKLLREMGPDELGLSFSGIKTAVLRTDRVNVETARICRDFQDTIFELVERNVERALAQTGLQTLVASGGVLANGTLRKRLTALCQRLGTRFVYPERRFLCTDNAGMVASLGFFHQEARGLDFPVSSTSGYHAHSASPL